MDPTYTLTPTLFAARLLSLDRIRAHTLHLYYNTITTITLLQYSMVVSGQGPCPPAAGKDETTNEWSAGKRYLVQQQQKANGNQQQEQTITINKGKKIKKTDRKQQQNAGSWKR